MTCKIVRTICFATLSMSLAAVVSAQGQRHCSNASLAGTWGYTETGTVLAPTGAVLAAAVGTYTFDRAGNFEGTQYSSAGGNISPDTKLGTYTVDSDCTGTLTLDVYAGDPPTQRRHSVWFIVLVDDANEIRAIMTSMNAPNATGVSLPPILTMSARRLFPDRDDGRRK